MVRKFLSKQAVMTEFCSSFLGKACIFLFFGLLLYWCKYAPVNVCIFWAFVGLIFELGKGYRAALQVIGYVVNDEYVEFTNSWYGMESVDRIALAEIKKVEYIRIFFTYDVKIFLLSGEIRHFHMLKKHGLLPRQMWTFEDVEQLCDLLSSSSK